MFMKCKHPIYIYFAVIASAFSCFGAAPSFADDIYERYHTLHEEIREIYNSYRRNEEKIFDNQEFEEKFSELKDCFDKLDFPTWKAGYVQERKIHPYVGKDPIVEQLVRQLYQSHLTIYHTFVDLAQTMIQHPDDTKDFFSTGDKNLQGMPKILRDKEENFMSAHQRYYKINSYILYENRRYN